MVGILWGEGRVRFMMSGDRVGKGVGISLRG